MINLEKNVCQLVFRAIGIHVYRSHGSLARLIVLFVADSGTLSLTMITCGLLTLEVIRRASI